MRPPGVANRVAWRGVWSYSCVIVLARRDRGSHRAAVVAGAGGGRSSPYVSAMGVGVTILGSTGSIGTQSLDVIEALGGSHRVVGLSADRRWEALAAQAARHGPEAVALGDASLAESLRGRLNGAAEVLAGPEGVVELARRPGSEVVISAIVGAAGLPATLAAVEAGKRVALANKEALVVGGSLVMPLAKARGATLLPIDSEHSAIFQALRAGRRSEVHRIYLTASGGPFRTWTAEQMAKATLDDALQHPTWSMGPKITIDSATMMNKALEIIEACWLFEVEPDCIEVVIHPESIIHSMVEFCDGSVIAQLGTPDMRTPIQYALTFPDRGPACGQRLDLAGLRRMHFEPPDTERFPALRLGFEAARARGTAGAVLNAANEAAVEAFRAGRIGFTGIVAQAEAVVRRHTVIPEPTLEQLLEADRWARDAVAEEIERAESRV